MGNEILYLKLDKKVKTSKNDVFIKDIGKLVCTNEITANHIKTMKLFCFRKNSEKTQVISVLKVIEQITKSYPAVRIESIGETETVVELVDQKKKPEALIWLKIALVAAVCFFGTSFTIMSYHNDISITKLFSGLYEIIMNKPSGGYTILEFSYSVGLSIGIIVFFNHIGKRRITKDPTPVEVEMRLYEDDVNTSIVETADREEKTIDVS